MTSAGIKVDLHDIKANDLQQFTSPEQYGRNSYFCAVFGYGFGV